MIDSHYVRPKAKPLPLLVLQCRRLSGVRYYSNHSVEVSRALGGMFGDSSLPVSSADFTAHPWQDVLQINIQLPHKLLSQWDAQSGDPWNRKVCICAQIMFEAVLWGSVLLQSLLNMLCKAAHGAAALTHHLLCVYNDGCILGRIEPRLEIFHWGPEVLQCVNPGCFMAGCPFCHLKSTLHTDMFTQT